MDLTERDLAVLEVAGRRWNYLGAKEQAIRDELGMTLTGYTQHLNSLLDRPEAYIAQPMLIKRLRRVREQRRQVRAG